MAIPARTLTAVSLCMIAWVIARPAWAQSPVFRPYGEWHSRFGQESALGQGRLFLPLKQNEHSLLFAELRDVWAEADASQTDVGLGYRELTADDWIWGAYAFFGTQRSSTGNEFRQASVGLEWLSVPWEFRGHAYLPVNEVQEVPSLNTAFLADDTLRVRQGQERPYAGIDAEVGHLLSTFGGRYDSEVRGFVGGYFYNNDAPGFNDLGGPLARIELRLFDLPLLGNDSRLELGGEVRWDQVRDTHGLAHVVLRIPLGRRGERRRKLTPLQRRMVSRIQSDLEIVTNTGLGPIEAAKFARTGMPVGPVTVLDANDDVPLGVTNAPLENTVILDGTAGPIDNGATVALRTGQTVIGGGADVIGCNTGAQARFGERPDVSAPANLDVFEIADQSTLDGMNIHGGRNGVFGDNRTGFTISDNRIFGLSTATDTSGIRLDGVSDGLVIGNRVKHKRFGYRIANLAGGSIQNNLASANRVGFLMPVVTGGSVNRNQAIMNETAGFSIVSLSGGSVVDNVADRNQTTGLAVAMLAGTGVVAGNSASENMGSGFSLGTMSGGTFVSNRSVLNETGYTVTQMSGGVFSDNEARGNAASGFDVAELSDTGWMHGNVAEHNGLSGFEIDLVSGTAIVSGNISRCNESIGFDFASIRENARIWDNKAKRNEIGFSIDSFSGGLLGGNRASRNRVHGFQIEFWSDGLIDRNVARCNCGDGFNIGQTPPGWTGGILSNNTSLDNADAGFEIGTRSGGSAFGNRAAGNDDNQLPAP